MGRTTELNSAIVSATELSFPANTPVFMVNLLRYKEHADYGNAAGASPCSGKEIYFQRYAGWFRKIAADKGINISQVKGSGENGRIVKSDVENFSAPTAVNSLTVRPIASWSTITALTGSRKSALRRSR